MKEGIGVGRQERMADVVALGDGGCELFELSRHDFRDIVKRYVSGCVRPCVCVRVFVRSPPPPGAAHPFRRGEGRGLETEGKVNWDGKGFKKATPSWCTLDCLAEPFGWLCAIIRGGDGGGGAEGRGEGKGRAGARAAGTRTCTSGSLRWARRG